ncbi:MAG: ATP-binding cassette domain-containing protein [Candidatus Hydrothermarchaeaceae archaeon]
MSTISIKGLTKEFNGLVAVDDVSLDIEEGELFGLLGPNGAGKTTLISMLYTMQQPTGGAATVCGYDVRTNAAEVRKCIGVVFQDPSLDQYLTGWENLDFHGRLYGMEGEMRKKRIREVLALVELEDKADQLVKTYSGGMRRRLELARGLMHSPQVLFLDEPTLGLDPQTRRHIWDYIERLNREEGITMILTTHYMDEADLLCGRIAIIDKGKIITSGTPEELKGILEGDVVYMISTNQETLLSELDELDWITNAKLVDGLINLNVKEGETAIPRIIELARGKGIQVVSVGLHKPTLEDVFIHYTGRTIREEVGGAKDRMRDIIRARMR